MTTDPRELAAVFLGGMVGALARSGLVDLFGATSGAWPWATFTVNILGAFLLGYFVTRIVEALTDSPYAHPFLATGFCGALTTFSALQLELLGMIESGRLLLALGYSSISLTAGLLAVALGASLVRRTGTVG